MRIVVHDYCGHPPQVQLSRALAERGHSVLHIYSPSVGSPRGAIYRLPEDPLTFDIAPVELDQEFHKYSPFRRIPQEGQYGRRVCQQIAQFGADLVISANTPLLSQWAIQRGCRRQSIPFVFWLQDVLGIGVRNVLSRRAGHLGSAAAEALIRLEASLLRSSAAIVSISVDFSQLLLQSYGVPASLLTVIENWAPIADLPESARENSWKQRHGLSGKRIALYAGTLGLKHDPGLILELARRTRAQADIHIVVASEGLGAEWLQNESRTRGLSNLSILDFQPFNELATMLAAADVLLVVLEADAGVFSVPSKVLSYLCAGRPLLAAVPDENLAARIVKESGAGVVVSPGDAAAFAEAGCDLLSAKAECLEMGAAGRRYAEQNFNIETITDRFEQLFIGLDRHTTPRETRREFVAQGG